MTSKGSPFAATAKRPRENTIASMIESLGDRLAASWGATPVWTAAGIVRVEDVVAIVILVSAGLAAVPARHNRTWRFAFSQAMVNCVPDWVVPNRARVTFPSLRYVHVPGVVGAVSQLAMDC